MFVSVLDYLGRVAIVKICRYLIMMLWMVFVHGKGFDGEFGVEIGSI